MSTKNQKEIEKFATDLSKKWYGDDYGGYHWGTADEIVEEFILWLYKNGGEIKEEPTSKIVKEMIAINTVIKIINRMPEEKQQKFFQKMAKKIKVKE